MRDDVSARSNGLLRLLARSELAVHGRLYGYEMILVSPLGGTRAGSHHRDPFDPALLATPQQKQPFVGARHIGD